MSVQKIEGEAIGLGVVVIAVALWLAWRGLYWPYQLYPDSLFSYFATGIDQIFASLGLQGSGYEKSIDARMGPANEWLSSHLPSYANSASFADYQESNPSWGGATVDANNPYGAGGNQ